jgi:hypothetical protein
MPLHETLWTPDDMTRFVPSEAAAMDLKLLPSPHAWQLSAARTLWQEDAPLAVYGLVWPWDHQQGPDAYVFLLCSQHIRPYRWTLARHLRGMLATLWQEYATPFCTEVRMPFTPGHRFLKMLGFQASWTFMHPETMDLYQCYRWEGK